MAENIEDFFTQKHKRLDRISRAANIFSWIVLVFYILQAFQHLLGISQDYSIQSSIQLLIEFPDIAITFLIDLIGILFGGVVYWLLLQGISLGLNMIVETDLNYREQAQGSINE